MIRHPIPEELNQLYKEVTLLFLSKLKLFLSKLKLNTELYKIFVIGVTNQEVKPYLAYPGMIHDRSYGEYSIRLEIPLRLGPEMSSPMITFMGPWHKITAWNEETWVSEEKLAIEKAMEFLKETL